LAVAKGNRIDISAVGDDALLAVNEMIELINNKFGEAE